MIDSSLAGISDTSRCVFNFHDPPNDSTLDTCPLLDWSTDPPTPIVKAGQVVMHGAGSKSVRKAIETHRPQLGLTSGLAYTVVFGVIAVSAIWYFLAKAAQKRRGINVEFAFKEIPPE
ncbi:MAG: hypothetical protein AB1449_03825 [Chloroflexota bacterium]